MEREHNKNSFEIVMVLIDSSTLLLIAIAGKYSFAHFRIYNSSRFQVLQDDIFTASLENETLMVAPRGLHPRGRQSVRNCGTD
jgi:hypothetical protein